MKTFSTISAGLAKASFVSAALAVLPAASYGQGAAFRPPEKAYCMGGICLGDTYEMVQATKGPMVEPVVNMLESVHIATPLDLKLYLKTSFRVRGIKETSGPNCTDIGVGAAVIDADKFTYNISFANFDPAAAPEKAYRVVGVTLLIAHGAGKSLSQDALAKAITSLRDRLKLRPMPKAWRGIRNRDQPEWYSSIDSSATNIDNVSVSLTYNDDGQRTRGAILRSTMWRDSVVRDHPACSKGAPKL